jgi:2-polyprenyl-6-methoxyphenol hydroxylase-like FAD-dependent oxidoreductase
MIPQSETERVLEETLAGLGVTVERRVELAHLVADADGVATTLRHADGREEALRTAWVVACDGAHSTVRHQLGLDFAGEVEPNDWVLADVQIEGPVPCDEISLYWHRSGVLALFPIGPGRFRIIADLGLASSAEHPADPTLAQTQALLDERGPGGLVVREPHWLAGFRINERKLADYRHGRVLLAGDAAHVHSPAGGQGMNTGMQDAYNLGWKLALVHAGRARDALLDTYSRERSAVGDLVLRNAAAMTRVATARHPVAQELRNRLAPLIASLGFVQARFKATLSELAIEYGSSALSGEHRGLTAHAWLLGGGVAPGARAPDGVLIDARSGAAHTLFALHDAGRHALLLFAGAHPDAAGTTALGEIARALVARFGDDTIAPLLIVAPGYAGTATLPTFVDPELALHGRYAAAVDTLYLIRPDGYVGFRSQPATLEHVTGHLERYLVPATSTAR